MLDKFRCAEIVHFYGASLAPNHLCLVIEYAPHHSAQDLIDQHADVAFETRVGFLGSAARGLAYLHTNGILHRDIKPANVLVFSLAPGVAVPAKLSDFGSSRNTSQTFETMTFTKGVGTPAYMAPEILGMQHYNTPADIYSLGVTMYEVGRWASFFVAPRFSFPWDIADFVLAGRRPEQDDLPDAFYAVVSQCWCQDKAARLTADQVVSKLSDGQACV